MFYIFDYFTEIEKIDFSNLSSFNVILNFNELQEFKCSKSDYQKYFKGTKSNIDSIDKLHLKISKDLQIDVSRLKPI